MIIHLGKKPVRGGKPPRERRIIRDVVIMRGALLHVLENRGMEVIERI